MARGKKAPAAAADAPAAVQDAPDMPPELEGLFAEESAPDPSGEEDSRRVVEDLAREAELEPDADEEPGDLEETAPTPGTKAKPKTDVDDEDDFDIDLLPDDLKDIARDFAPPKEAKRDDDDISDILALIGEDGPRETPRPAATPESPSSYRAVLPEEYVELQPLFDDIVGELSSAKKEIATLNSQLQQQQQRASVQTLQQEMQSIQTKYKQNFEKLAPRVQKILREAPEMAMTFAGLQKAFYTADLEYKYLRLRADAQGRRKSGAVSNASGRRAAASVTPAVDLSGVKSTRDAVRVAARLMKSRGMLLPEEEV